MIKEKVDCCCCKATSHGYFLIINYFTQLCFVSITEYMYYQIHNTIRMPIFFVLLHFLFAFSSSAFIILTLISFFFYVFADDHQTAYHKFHINYQIIFLIVFISYLFLFLILIFSVGESLDLTKYLFVNATHLACLGVLLYYSYRLKSVTYADEDKDEERKTKEKSSVDVSDVDVEVNTELVNQ